MSKKKQTVNLANNYNYLLDEKPEGFVFKPACGTVNEEGIITVSGMNFTEQQVENSGKRYENLVSVLSEIQADSENKKNSNLKSPTVSIATTVKKKKKIS